MDKGHNRTVKVFGMGVKGLLDWIGLGEVFSDMLQEDRGFSEEELQKIRNAITRKVANDDVKIQKLDNLLATIDNPLIQGIGAEALSKAKQGITKARNDAYTDRSTKEALLNNKLTALEAKSREWAINAPDEAKQIKKDIENVIGGIV